MKLPTSRPTGLALAMPLCCLFEATAEAIGNIGAVLRSDEDADVKVILRLKQNITPQTASGSQT